MDTAVSLTSKALLQNININIRKEYYIEKEMVFFGIYASTCAGHASDPKTGREF